METSCSRLPDCVTLRITLLSGDVCAFFWKMSFVWITLDYFLWWNTWWTIAEKKDWKKCLIQPFWPIMQGKFHISMWMQVINNQVMSYPFVTSKLWELGFEFKCITISTVVSPKEIFPYSFFIFLRRSCKKKRRVIAMRYGTL